MGRTKEEPPWQEQLGCVILKTGGREACVHPDAKVALQVGDVPLDSRQWCAFEFAEHMEQGNAPGLISSFVEPVLGPDGREDRLLVQRSENMREYLLKTERNDPLLLAVQSSDTLRFDIYIARPGRPRDALGPAFLLQSNGPSRKSWTLESSRCECCEARGRRSCGVRQLGRMNHYVESVGNGQALCMDVDVPAPLSVEEGGSAVWCSVCNGQQGHDQGDDESSIASLSTRRPKWNPTHKTLTLNFDGRVTVASSKNFQLEDSEMPGERRLLFGKTSTHGFVLDYKRPFGMIQAFATALTASHWT